MADTKPKRRMGDRRDGRWVRDVPGLQTIMGHLMPNRTDAEVFMKDSFDVTELLPYLDAKNATHPDYKTTVFHALIMSVARMLKERPKMNYFIQGRRMYERYDISLSFVCKRRFQDNGEEALMFFVPKEERGVIDEIMSQNGLAGATPEETLENIERFFATFNYTLDQKNRAGDSYLADFLNNTREGHCEYFATATVLMLRNAGIAARYRTGYMLDEYDSFENALIARKRDAHAWAAAYIGDRWVDVDTTPPQWKEADSMEKSFFEPVSDFMAWVKMKYENYRRKKSDEFNKILIAAASILTVFLMVRVYLRKRRVKKSLSDEITPLFEAAGLDSPLYQMLDYYAGNGLTREESETLRRWIEKNREKLGENIDFSAFVRLHEELRFNTGGDKTALKSELMKKYEEWKKSKES